MMYLNRKKQLRLTALFMAMALAFPGQALAEDGTEIFTDTEMEDALEESWLLEAEAPVTEPAVTEAPTTEAPATEPPVTEPPVTEAPTTEAPATEPPVTEPPATEAPATEPPATEPPVTAPPVTEAPETDTPVTDSTVGESSSETQTPSGSETQPDTENQTQHAGETLPDTEADTQPSTETETQTGTETVPDETEQITDGPEQMTDGTESEFTSEPEEMTEKESETEKETEEETEKETEEMVISYEKSALFLEMQNRIKYSVTVPMEGIPSFITQEMVVGALKCQDEYGFPASVTIAQIIAESGYGSYGPGGESGQGLSQLAYAYCNLFGIKGTGTAGSVPMKTWEMKKDGSTYTTTAGFRAYYTYTECIEDRAQLLLNYYSDLTEGVSDANTFAVQVGSRWATNLYYGQTLIQIMETYDLYRLDEMTLMDFSVLIGRFANPCPGAELTSPFGYREFDKKVHKGVDFGTGAENIPTYAADAGIVTYAAYDETAGNMIIIDHGDGLVTKYMHHLEMYVEAGDEVEKGQQIGLSGTTGRSTGNHLHFQVEEYGIAVDPLPYLVTEREEEQTEADENVQTEAADVKERTEVITTDVVEQTEAVSEMEKETDTEDERETESETAVTETDVTEHWYDLVAGACIMTVNDNVYARRESSVEAEIISLLQLGTIINVTGEEGEWKTVEFEKSGEIVSGYVKAEFVIDTENLYQATEKVNVRKEASAEAEKAGKLAAGEKIFVLEQMEDGWAKVSYRVNGELIEAYVKSEFLEKAVFTENTAEDVSETEEVLTEEAEDETEESMSEEAESETEEVLTEEAESETEGSETDIKVYDVNQSGKVDINDVQCLFIMLQSYDAGEFEGEDVMEYDLNQDQRFSTEDIDFLMEQVK